MGIDDTVDVIVINTERFEATKEILGGIAYPTHKYGRVLFEVALSPFLTEEDSVGDDPEER